MRIYSAWHCHCSSQCCHCSCSSVVVIVVVAAIAASAIAFSAVVCCSHRVQVAKFSRLSGRPDNIAAAADLGRAKPGQATLAIVCAGS